MNIYEHLWTLMNNYENFTNIYEHLWTFMNILEVISSESDCTPRNIKKIQSQEKHSVVDTYEHFRTLMSTSEQLWNTWTCINKFEQCWAILNMYEHLRTFMNTYEHLWTRMNIYKHSRSNLIRLWLHSTQTPTITNEIYMQRYSHRKSTLLWISMNTYEHLWTFMDIYEHLWTLMNNYDNYEQLWTVMNFNEYCRQLWTLMNTDEHLWASMNLNEHSRSNLLRLWLHSTRTYICGDTVTGKAFCCEHLWTLMNTFEHLWTFMNIWRTFMNTYEHSRNNFPWK